MAQRGSDTMLDWKLATLILVSVGCSALAQVALKHGMSQGPVQAALADGGLASLIGSTATQSTIGLGLFLYGFSALVWLLVLARLDVSIAYAFVALGFLLTMTLGWMVLGEPLTLRKVAGTACVAVGIWLVATSARSGCAERPASKEAASVDFVARGDDGR